MKTIFSHKRFKYHIFYFCENVINSSIILLAYNGMFYSSFIHFTLYYYVAAVVVVAVLMKDTYTGRKQIYHQWKQLIHVEVTKRTLLGATSNDYFCCQGFVAVYVSSIIFNSDVF